jgi:hypothetical protein
MKLLFFAFIVSAFIAISSIANAQQLATPLKPEEYPFDNEIGIVFGLGGNIQSGIFSSSCDCDFENGTKFGYTFGALYEYEIMQTLELGAAALFDYRGVESEYQEIENVPVTSQQSGLSERVNVLFTNKGEADLNYFSLVPYLKWNPFRFMFVRLGLNAAFPISTNIKHTKILETKTAKLSTGEIVSIELPDGDGNQQIIQDEEMPEVNSPILALDPAIGFTIHLSDKVSFAPVFQYSIPLSNIAEIGSDFKVSSWRILFEFKYSITDYTYFKSKSED